MKRSTFFIVVFSLIYFIGHAQPPGNPGSGNGGATDPDNAPITGIEYLLGIGGLYGIKRLMKRKPKDL